MQWSDDVFGWISFSGEFLLFQTPDALAANALTHCISGSLPTEMHGQAARELEGKYVVVSGPLVVWTAGTDDRAMPDRTTPVRNLCNAPLIMLGTSIREVAR